MLLLIILGIIAAYFAVGYSFYRPRILRAGKLCAELSEWLDEKQKSLRMADYGWWCDGDKKERYPFHEFTLYAESGGITIHSMERSTFEWWFKANRIGAAYRALFFWPLILLSKPFRGLRITTGFNEGASLWAAEKTALIEAEERQKETNRLILENNLDPNNLLGLVSKKESVTVPEHRSLVSRKVRS